MLQESLDDSSCVGHAPGAGGVESERVPAKPKGPQKKEGPGKIHYAPANLTGKYQNVSSTPGRGRGGKLTGGICQVLNQAWTRAEREAAGCPRLLQMKGLRAVVGVRCRIGVAGIGKGRKGGT